MLAVLAAAAFGWTYYGYLTKGFPVWTLLISLAVFSTLSVLEVFLAERAGRAWAVLFFESFGVVGFFWRVDARVLSVIWLVVLIFLAWGYFSARRRLANSIEIPFFGTASEDLGKLTTGLLLFMILVYAPQAGNNPLLVSQKGFGSFFDWASNVANGFYPELSFNGTFGSFSESVARMELANNPNFQNLNPDQKTAAIVAQTTQFERNFLQNAATSTTAVASSSPTSDAFYSVLQGMANAWQSEAGGWFLVGWIAVIFIALRSVGVIFVWIEEFVALVFYELLLATGFMKIHEEEHVREVIGF